MIYFKQNKNMPRLEKFYIFLESKNWNLGEKISKIALDELVLEISMQLLQYGDSLSVKNDCVYSAESDYVFFVPNARHDM